MIAMNGLLAATLIELPLLVRVLCVAVLVGGLADVLFRRRGVRAADVLPVTRTNDAVPRGCEEEVRLIRSLFTKLNEGKEVRVIDRDEGLLALERIHHRLVGIRREEVTRQQQLGIELTKSEREVMKLMREGYSPQRIATILGCSLSRVYKARSGLRRKLNIPDHTSMGDYLRSMPD
jgi:DNA-binding CsgD family transcriptional regulator